MVALGQTRDEARGLLGISAGHLSHVLGGTRGLGLELANKVKAVYAALGREVPTEAWEVDATPAEHLLIQETADRIPRRSQVALSAPPPGSP